MQRTNVAATSSPLTPVASTPHRLRAALSPRSTPGSFRLTAAVVTAICALCAVVAAAAIVARAGSLNGAGTEAQQLVDLQEIRTATVEADAIAASSFLGGSEESANQQVDYEARLGDATALLADVAQRATTSDLPNLAIANDTLVRYAGLVEQARANNRQGFPVGASYQRQASNLLRTDFLPAIDAVDVASRDRLNDSLTESTRNGAIAVILLAVALVALLLASLLLMRRTRRLVNVPIAIGAVLVAAALVWTVAVVATTGSDVRNTVDTSLRGADALSRARTAAFDARSAESLTLINRGNGAANEADWQLADAEVVAAVDEACSSDRRLLRRPVGSVPNRPPGGQGARRRRELRRCRRAGNRIGCRHLRRLHERRSATPAPTRPRRRQPGSTTPRGRWRSCGGSSWRPGCSPRRRSSSASANGSGSTGDASPVPCPARAGDDHGLWRAAARRAARSDGATDNHHRVATPPPECTDGGGGPRRHPLLRPRRRAAAARRRCQQGRRWRRSRPTGG